MNVWEGDVEVGLREVVMMCKQYSSMSKTENYRHHICIENDDRKVQRGSRGAAFCLCGSIESLREGTEGGTVVLYEGVSRSMGMYLSSVWICVRAV